MRLILLCLLSLLMMNCSPQKKFEIEIEKRIVLKDVPGGSGLTLYKDTLFLVGDNSPFLFLLNKQYKVIGKKLLFKDHEQTPLIEKSSKPDLECLTLESGEDGDFLYSFGSGSLSPHRDVAVKLRIDQEETPEVFSLGPLYEAIRKRAGLSVANLNIEVCVILKDKLYLFNRGSNEIIRIPLKGFKDFLRDSAFIDSLEIDVFPIELPEVDGKMAAFSGATAIGTTNKILFTATIEDTDNWIDDGEVLGSYVGVLNVNKLEDGKIEALSLVSQKGQKKLDKLESIALYIQDDKGDFLAAAVADNDDGTSVLLELRISGLNN